MHVFLTWLKDLLAWLSTLFGKAKQAAPQIALPTPHGTRTYAFRIRVNRPSNVSLNSTLTRIDYPVEQAGIALSLRASSSERDKSIHDADRWVFIGEGYSSENEASNAGDLFQDALMLALTKVRVGVDFGARAGKTVLTKYGEQFYSQQHGKRVLHDVHGLTVYDIEPPPSFLTQNISAVVGRNTDTFNHYLSAFIARQPQLTDRERLALQLFHVSFFQPTADTRFLLLVMAIEALIEPIPKSLEAIAHVNNFISEIQNSGLQKTEKCSLIGSLQWMRDESINQSGRRLVQTRLGTKKYQGKACHKFFSEVYSLRSALVHGKTPFPTFEEVSNIVADVEGFVSDLLTAKL
jgi:Apea-like HEPN